MNNDDSKWKAPFAVWQWKVTKENLIVEEEIEEVLCQNDCFWSNASKL